MPESVRNHDFGPVIQEIQRREVQVTGLEVVKAPMHGRTYALGVPGTMSVIVSRAGSGVLTELRAAIKEGGSKLAAFHQRLTDQYAQGRRASPEEVAKLLIHAPVLADVRYGGHTLNAGITVPKNLDCYVAVFPYNGGPLAREGFELVEYPKDGATERLEALVIEAAPELSPAEAAALKLVPVSQLGRNVGASLDCDTTWLAVGALAVGATTAAALAVGNAMTIIAIAAITAMQLGQAVHLSEDQIKTLGPAASARQLLAMRRQALLEARVG